MAFIQKFAMDPAQARIAMEETLFNVNVDTEEGVQMTKPLDADMKDLAKANTGTLFNRPCPVRKSQDEEGSYGSLQKPVGYSFESAGIKVGQAYGYVQQLVMIVAALWLLWAAGHRIGGLLSGTSKSPLSSGSPSPSPGLFGQSLPTCSAYKYPQCEAAMRWYLSQNARNRCEAFERVKAEGDFFKNPYSETSQELCTTAGCCNCPGQCSKCPPVLPECSTWQVDGTWKVAFADGTDAKYAFDAHGHVEMELSPRALPMTWKSYQQSYIPRGSDLDSYPKWLSIQDAERLCNDVDQCHGITYDESTRTGSEQSQPIYFIYLKTTSAFAPGPGTGWITLIEEQRPELHGTVAIAGPVTKRPEDDAGTMRFDLHQAAPQLFPELSTETYKVVDDELKVERRVRGQVAQTGTGVLTRS